MGRFRSNFWRRIRIRNQNRPIASGFWDIWGYMLEKLGFSLLLRLCTGRKKFFWYFIKCHHLALLFPFKMSYWTITSDFYSQRYGHIKFDSKWRIEIYEIKRFCSLKTLTRGFRSCWLRKWGRKIDISISKMVDSISRIEIDREHSIGIWNPAFGGFTVVKYFM